MIPSEGKITAPFSGTITALFPTGHAIGITSDHGTEVLIHVGKDTYNLKEELFRKYVKQGDHVRAGDTLITFDINQLKEAGYDPITAVVVSNSSDYLDVVGFGKTAADFNDDLLATVVSKPAA